MIIHVLLSAFTSRSSVSLIGLIPNVVGHISFVLSLCLVVVFLHLLVILMCFYQPQTSRTLLVVFLYLYLPGCKHLFLLMKSWLHLLLYILYIFTFVVWHPIFICERFFIEILLMLRFQCFVSYISETVLVKSAYFGWSKYCCWLNPTGCRLISTSLHVAIQKIRSWNHQVSRFNHPVCWWNHQVFVGREAATVHQSTSGSWFGKWGNKDDP